MRYLAGKRKDFGSSPFSALIYVKQNKNNSGRFWGFDLHNKSDNWRNIKMALIGALLMQNHSGGDSVAIGKVSTNLPPPPVTSFPVTTSSETTRRETSLTKRESWRSKGENKVRGD